MNFSIAATIRRLFVPQHELSVSWFVWRRLLIGLRERGRNRSSESGAFLLGRRSDGRAHITAFILYDDLDPHCLDTGIVRFDGRHFGALWEYCRQRDLSVVADIHVHPGGSGQSESDRHHPMISRAGHLALILPEFAAPPVQIRSIGVYRYLGGKKWETIPPNGRAAFFFVGF